MIAVIWVNLRRAMGDRRLLIIGTLVPVVIILITGLLEGSPKEPIGLLHPSSRLLHLAQTTDGIKVRVESNRTDLTDDILRGRVVAGIVQLPSQTDSVRADFLVESATTDAVQAHTDVVALMDLMAAEGPNTKFTDETLRGTQTQAPLSPFAYVAPANLVLFMGIAVLVLAAGMVETRRLGVLQRLSAAPVRKRAIVFGQMASMMVTALAMAIGLIFVGIVLFNVHWGNPLSVFLVVALLAISIAALSVIIGTWARSQEQAIATAVIVAIIAGMLGGCVYQLDTVSTTVNHVGHIVPQAWAMDAFVKLIYDHATFTDTLPQIGALAVFAVVLSALAVWYYYAKGLLDHMNDVTDLADPVMFYDPYPRYRELRRHAPVAPGYSKQMLGGAGYLLTRHEHVLLLHNDVRFSSDPTSQGSSFLMRHLPKMFRLLTSSMVYKDDPDHARLRRLVNKAFTPRMVQQLAGEIERIVTDLVDTVAKKGSETVDLVEEVAVPLPLSVISTMLGVGDAERDEFHVLMERFVVRLGSGSAADAVRAIPTARELYAVLERLAAQRRAVPDDGLISALLQASEDGDSLSDDEVMAMIFLLMLAGHDTTANLIGSSALALMEHPDQAERLRNEPELMTAAVEELLRFTTPVPCGAARTLLHDVELDGTTMPKGSKVLGMIISANRDEAVFEQPDALDLGRDPNRHLTFAFGKHFCLGNQLARLEGQLAIGELVRHFPHMRLAVPRDTLRYKPVQALRGFHSLPVTLQ